MIIHEFQAKELLSSFGVPVPNGGLARNVSEAEKVAADLGGSVWVIKSQIHAGGRGAGYFTVNPNGGGGIRVAHSLDAVREAAEAMLGKVLVTKQTGKSGRKVRCIYVEAGCNIERELYLSMLVDRQSSRITIVASTNGGMDVEEVADKTPDSISKVTIDPAVGMSPFYVRKVAFGLSLRSAQAVELGNLVSNLYKVFTKLDATLIELNPLVVTESGQILALDAKMDFDDNALFRHQDLLALEDLAEENLAEQAAKKSGLNYITLGGNIGCMVNGAGLAMATMDIIKFYGGEPANFLDVGGNADKERVAAAFKIIVSDQKVEGILVNIFGGIMRCDVIAEGVVSAAREVGLKVPLVVRLEGTNVDLGKEILRESGLIITSANDLSDAASKIVSEVSRKA